MARPKGSFKDFPTYRQHPASGQAIVTLSGQTHYLGDFGSPASRAKYDRLLSEWIANGRQPLLGDDRTVTEVVAAFWSHAKDYYAPPADAKSGGEIEHFRAVLKLLRQTYGEESANDFGPLKLSALMGEMVKAGWSRRYVNAQANRLKRVFKWAVSKELVLPHVHQALATVSGFRKGKTAARETEKVRPVPQEHIDAVKPHVSRQVKALIELQLVTGMRPGEAVIMRGRDIDTTGAVWVYRPSRHKKQHLEADGSEEHGRSIDLGPRAQDIIRPFLKPDLTAFLFSPIDAEAERQEDRRRARNPKTPVTPSQRLRAERAAARQRKRPLRPRYTVATYRRAIARGCEKAFEMPADLKPAKAPADAAAEQKAAHEKAEADKSKKRAAWRTEHTWHPHQLRHNAATRLRKEFGLDVARIVLGHTSDTMTAVYAERDREKAREIMGRVG